MHARFSSYRGDMDKFIEGFSGIVMALEQWEGLHHAHLLVDREAGEAIAASFWTSEEAVLRSNPIADDMRNRVSAEAGVTIEGIRRYEVVMTVKGPESDDPFPPPAGSFTAPGKKRRG